jgi:hypothetical protein
VPYARTLSRPARVATQSTLTPGEDPKGFSESEPEEVRSGPGIYLAHNSAKLKIFNLPTSIQLLRCGPLRGLDGTLWIPSPAIRWSVGSEPAVRFARIRGTMLCMDENNGSISPSRRFHSACARARGASRPDIHLL